MKIVTARKISQAVFLTLFVWFCIVTDIGTQFYQIRGWPINLFLGADPLVAFGTVLASGSLYSGVIAGVVILIATIFLGRFFCGWICPFGAFHQLVSWLSWRKKKSSELIAANRYSKFQRVKYYILFVFVGTAIVWKEGSLLTGLLDPIPMFTRSVNLAILPIAGFMESGVFTRSYEFSFGFFAVFLLFALLNLIRPRFFCKFICPTGALLGVFSRFSVFRVAKAKDDCRMCGLCEKNCHGSASPKTATRLSECMLCFNCREVCPDEVIGYMPAGSCKATISPDISRRGMLLSLVGGMAAGPAMRASAKIEGENWDNSIIRSPGALPEKEFLDKCIKCGQCIRVCPSNVLQPAPISKGLEVMWTPTLNNRIGLSGCQLNCTACGSVCPTGAIKHLTLDEKHGTGEFEQDGPVKIGTAFVDRNRCLPWAMNKPCIVCQENCPVSPKALFTLDVYEPIRDYSFEVSDITVEGENSRLVVVENMNPRYATGDYFVSFAGKNLQITEIDGDKVMVDGDASFIKPSDLIEIKLHLQRPAVDIDKCIGCGICEHECPVSGLRAIRVTAEGQSREPSSRLLLE